MRSSRLFWILAVTIATATVAVTTSGCAGERVSATATETDTNKDAAFPAVAVVRADSGTLETAIELSGNLAPETRVDIRSKLTGTLDKVCSSALITEGQTLATLDRREIDAQVDAAVAAVALRRASTLRRRSNADGSRTRPQPEGRTQRREPPKRSGAPPRSAISAANVEQANAAAKSARSA